MPSLVFGAQHNSLPPIRLVVLDIGGTLIQDRGDVPELLRRSLGHYGINSTPEDVSRWRGASKREIIRHFVDQQSPVNTDREKLTAAIYNKFTAELIEVYRSVPPISGAKEAILEMRKAGYLVATTTGFDRAMTDSILSRLDWKKFFVATISSDDVARGRPSPFMLFHAMELAQVNSVAEVMSVGDTPLDLQAGANAGLRGVVGVLSGAFTAEKLGREPHTHIVQSVANVPALLASKL
jgi:phosphonatase-like hydrolase